MSKPCNINHKSDETRSRCHNPQCRQRAASRTPAAAAGPSVPLPGRTLTLSDAAGRPITINLDHPVVHNATLSAASMVALPKGARLERCTLLDGAYDLTDVTLHRCEVAPGASVALRGNSMIADTRVAGQVSLWDESSSSKNAYFTPPTLHGSAVSDGDAFRYGFDTAADFTGVISHRNAVGPWDRDSEGAPRPAGVFKSALRSSLLAGLQSLWWSSRRKTPSRRKTRR